MVDETPTRPGVAIGLMLVHEQAAVKARTDKYENLRVYQCIPTPLRPCSVTDLVLRTVKDVEKMRDAIMQIMDKPDRCGILCLDHTLIKQLRDPDGYYGQAMGIKPMFERIRKTNAEGGFADQFACVNNIGQMIYWLREILDDQYEDGMRGLSSAMRRRLETEASLNRLFDIEYPLEIAEPLDEPPLDDNSEQK